MMYLYDDKQAIIDAFNTTSRHFNDIFYINNIYILTIWQVK